MDEYSESLTSDLRGVCLGGAYAVTVSCQAGTAASRIGFTSC